MRSTYASRCSPACSQKSEKRPKITHTLWSRAFVFSGASGCGKTTLLNAICQDPSLNTVKAAKFAERQRRGDDDDVTHVNEITPSDFDPIYIINGNWYGIKTESIRQQLAQGKNACVILSDFRVIRRVRSLFRTD